MLMVGYFNYLQLCIVWMLTISEFYMMVLQLEDFAWHRQLVDRNCDALHSITEYVTFWELTVLTDINPLHITAVFIIISDN